jgi:CheY-like chemotaxis protein
MPQAENAATGMAVAIREPPDVIILEVRLPDRLGFAAAIILREHPLARDFPFVFVIASAMPGGKEEIRDIPSTGVIGKPIDARRFAREIGASIQCIGASPAAATPDQGPWTAFMFGRRVLGHQTRASGRGPPTCKMAAIVSGALAGG